MASRSLDAYDAVVFDVDGVTLISVDEHGGQAWQRTMALDIGVTPEQVSGLFAQPDAHLVRISNADFVAIGERYFANEGVAVTFEQFLAYWYAHEPEFDQRILTLSQQLRARGVRTYIGTDQDNRRGPHLWHARGLRDHFDGKFTSYEIGHGKPSREFFAAAQAVIEADSPGARVLFLDDRVANAEGCAVAGWDGYHYLGWESFAVDFGLDDPK